MYIYICIHINVNMFGVNLTQNGNPFHIPVIRGEAEDLSIHASSLGSLDGSNGNIYRKPVDFFTYFHQLVDSGRPNENMDN